LKGGERYPEEYAGLSLPIGIIYGSDSELFSKETLDYMLSLIRVDVEVCAIEGAQHHVFLDQPLEFAHELGDMIMRLRAH
jgi:pimeloyl-ACP methyl ester carboxylesterase